MLEPTAGGRRRRSFGMLLAEALMAMTLLSVVSLLLIGLIPTAGKAVSKARAHGKATQLCQHVLTEARTSLFADLGDRIQAVAETETLDGQTVTVNFQVQRRVTEINPRLKKIEATVSWPANGLAYVRMATLVRNAQ